MWSTEHTAETSLSPAAVWTALRALHEGRPEDVEGLTRIEAPAGVNVVDYVTKRWMQLEPRPLTMRLELAEADRPQGR